MADMLSLMQNQFLTQHTHKFKHSLIYKSTGKIQHYVTPDGFIILNHFNKDQLICFKVQMFSIQQFKCQVSALARGLFKFPLQDIVFLYGQK
jgi:hypothetical protein